MITWRRWGASLLFAGLVACGGGGTEPGDDDDGGNEPPPPEDGPASIELVSNPAFEPIDNQLLRMTLHLENTGGPGVYVVEVYEWNTASGDLPPLIARTEPVEVAADYDETASWQVYSPISAPPIHHILVLSRDQGSAQYRETDRYDVPFD